jgi:transcription elongation factor GreA
LFVFAKDFLLLQTCNATIKCGVVFFFPRLNRKNMSDYVTQETFDKMRVELHRMKSIDRPAASKAIGEAREKGDLKENAEYDAAKEAQGMLEAKIKQLEGVISNAKIVDPGTLDISKVTILTKVTITNLATKKTITYQIVGEKEADLKIQKISASSPIGKGLLGKVIGETAEVQTPNGVIKFKIENISI